MNRLLTRILLLDHVADERLLEHGRRSTSISAVVGTLVAFLLLEYHLLVEHRIPWDLISLIYAMGATKVAFLLWYRFKN
ncbi:hypothetical protein ACOBR2_18845 [Telmatobacter bradus]|uniref:hypothetical protein n=1 Tax=Telmatobacter bradus TaxID=474953 RepID=UPI003B433A35